MSVSVNIDGLGSIQVNAEYTSSSVQQAYNNAVNVILNIANSPSDPTLTDLNNYDNAIGQLLSLARSSNPPITMYMANSIRSLVQMGEAILPGGQGFLVGSTPVQLQQWKNLVVQGFGAILQAAQVAGTNVAVSTLQSYIQLDYIYTGNTLLNNELTQLQQALETNKSALELLGNIQEFKNGILRSSLGTLMKNSNGAVFSFLQVQTQKFTQASLWGAGQGFATKHTAISIPKDYINAVAPELNHRLLVNIAGPSTIVQDIQARGQTLILQLQKLIPQVLALSPPASPPNGTTLGELLQKVLNQMTGNPNGTSPTENAQGNSIVNWLLDNYDDQSITLPDGTTLAASNFNVANSGGFQMNLTNAVNTAQSTNSALNTQLSTTFFIFNEFYDSASQALSTVNNMIVGMARSTARK